MAAMIEDYLAMAIGIVVIGLVAVLVFWAFKQDTGDEPPQPIPQMTPGPAGDCIV